MIAPHPAGRLGWRLRVYVAIVAARSLGMGITYWVSAPRIWRSPAFDVIEVLAPLRQPQHATEGHHAEDHPRDGERAQRG